MLFDHVSEAAAAARLMTHLAFKASPHKPDFGGAVTTWQVTNADPPALRGHNNEREGTSMGQSPADR